MDEIHHQKAATQCQDILKSILHFSKYLHPITLEFLANNCVEISSDEYEKNMSLTGKNIQISKSSVNKDNEIKHMSEIMLPQDITKLFNPNNDLLYV